MPHILTVQVVVDDDTDLRVYCLGHRVTERAQLDAVGELSGAGRQRRVGVLVRAVRAGVRIRVRSLARAMVRVLVRTRPGVRVLVRTSDHGEAIHAAVVTFDAGYEPAGLARLLWKKAAAQESYAGP